MRNKDFIRTKVIERDGYNCCFCNRVCNVKIIKFQDNFRDNNLTLDHIIPKSFGGKDYYCNLTISCRKCNTIRGNQSFFNYLNKWRSFDTKRIIKYKKLYFISTTSHFLEDIKTSFEENDQLSINTKDIFIANNLEIVSNFLSLKETAMSAIGNKLANGNYQKTFLELCKALQIREEKIEKISPGNCKRLVFRKLNNIFKEKVNNAAHHSTEQWF